MATHSSIPAWEIAWTEEPGGLPSMGSHRVGRGCVSEPTRGCLEDNMSRPVRRCLKTASASLWPALARLWASRCIERGRPFPCRHHHRSRALLHPQRAAVPPLSSMRPSPLHEQKRMLQGRTEAGLTPGSSSNDTGSWGITVPICASVIPSAKRALEF